MPLLRANAAAAASFHALADAQTRLKRGQRVEISLATTPQDRVLSDGLRRGLYPEMVAELQKKHERAFVRKTGA